MTLTAFCLRRDVISSFGCGNPRVMAGCTVIWIYAQMIKGDTGKGGEVAGAVTVRTIQARR